MVGGISSMNRSSVAPASRSCCEHVGVAVAEEVAEPGEEGVAVADLRRAPAVPPEGGVGVGGQRGGVPLQHGHLVAGPPEAQGGAQPGHARRPTTTTFAIRPSEPKLDRVVKLRISTRRLRVLIEGA